MSSDSAIVGEARGLRLAKLAFGAVGVVYGDIGTSPLYAVRECFAEEHGVVASEGNVLGILSLVFWALTIIVVMKYLVFVLRADNQGEGGILALLSLAAPRGVDGGRAATVLVMLGLFGAALLYGDAIITPAVSVLGAVEGLAVADPLFEPLALPISIVIIVVLFLCQRFGTGRLAAVFGFVMIAWFVSIAVVAAPWIAQRPEVLLALSPHYAALFFWNNGFHGFALLGSVVLCVTGGEALYADMGHFGRRGIRIAWYGVVYPALLLNYFGQGAVMLASPESASSPFFAMVPIDWLYPMIGLATAAAVVASQALISGAFSISHQAVSLGYFPRVTILHTSSEEKGQIYIPEVNEAMMAGCLALCIGFGSSSALAAAYGAAVTGTMTITSILFYPAMHARIGTKLASRLVALFLTFDVAFIGANALKLRHGGWVPIAVAVVVFTTMVTWRRGRAILGTYVADLSKPLADFLDELPSKMPHRVEGTAVFMTSSSGLAPPVLLHHLRHNRVLHERVILLTVRTENVPEVKPDERVEIEELAHGFHQVTARYGFVQMPNVPDIARACTAKGLPLAVDDATFYLGRETLLPTGKGHMMRWRKRLFTFLSRNSRHPTFHFRIPPDRVVEMGMQIEL